MFDHVKTGILFIPGLGEFIDLRGKENVNENDEPFTKPQVIFYHQNKKNDPTTKNEIRHKHLKEMLLDMGTITITMDENKSNTDECKQKEGGWNTSVKIIAVPREDLFLDKLNSPMDLQKYKHIAVNLVKNGPNETCTVRSESGEVTEVNGYQFRGVNHNISLLDGISLDVAHLDEWKNYYSMIKCGDHVLNCSKLNFSNYEYYCVWEYECCTCNQNTKAVFDVLFE